MAYRSLKICCAIASSLLITIAVVLVILYFTILKPKEPKIYPQPPTLESIRASLFPAPFLNFSLWIVVTIHNQNYGSFKYEESTAYIKHHTDVIGDAPIEDGEIPARSWHNMSTLATISAVKLLSNDNFLLEFLSGTMNFTSTSTLHGKATALKIFKKNAISSVTCYVTVFVQAQRAESVCKSKLGL